MFNRSGVPYIVLLLAAVLVQAGCSRPAPPPPAAQPSAPTIEGGTPSGPQEPTAGPALSDPGTGTPSTEQGDKK